VRTVTALIAALALLPATAVAQEPAASGSFAELSGEAGCMVQSGILTDNRFNSGEEELKGCDKGRGLGSATGVAVSPDGRHVYLAASGARAFGSNAVVTFARAADTGRLSFTECVSDDGGDGRVGTDGFCANGNALSGAQDVVLSPDGKFAYVPSAGSNGVAWFARDEASGRLVQKGCVKDVPREDDCDKGRALIGASSAAVSADGLHLYVTSRFSDAIAIFTRDLETGAIEQAGCISQTGTDGLCADGTALTGASSVSVSPDGASVYVTAAEIGAVTWYARDAATGLLTPKGCLVDDAPEGGVCTTSKPLAGAGDSTITPDGGQVIVAGRTNNTLTVFTRDPATGNLAQAACFQNQFARGDEVIPDPDAEEEEFEEEEEEFEDEPEEEEEPVEEEEVEEDDEDALLPGCTPAKALSSLSEVTTSADGRAVFATGGGTMAAFQRDPLTGSLTQFACAERYRTYKSCTSARGLSSASGIAASPDARNLYVTDAIGSLSTFGAVTAVAARTAKLARDGTATVRLACPAARSSDCDGRIAVAQRRRHAKGHRYLLAPGQAAGFRVTVPQRVRREVRRHRSARVMLVLRHSGRTARLSGRRITLRR
jgi:DNA-binding beta-propeller fold protein YncE